MNRTMRKETSVPTVLDFVDLEVRPRSEERSFRDVSLSAMNLGYSDKGLSMHIDIKS